MVEKNTGGIPLWLKVIVAGCIAGTSGILIRAASTDQDVLLGLSVGTILFVSLAILLLLVPVAMSFWFHPHSAYSLFCYWLMRLLREQICVLSLAGILYLLAVHAPLMSLRGGMSYATLLIVFAVGWRLKPVGLDVAPHRAFENLFVSIKNSFSRVEKLPAWMLRMAVILLPAAVVCFVIYFVFDSSFSNYGPFSFWNDEVAYWIWLRSFVPAGFNSGYNAPNELLPAFEFSRYGEASPIYLYLYGGIARLVGWFPAFPVLLNMILLTVSIFLYIRLVKPDNWQVVFAGLAILLTWPVLLYLPITTHETLNQAIGIVLIALIVRLLSGRDKAKPGARLAIVLFVYVAALARLSWGLMLIPALFYCLNGKLWQRIVLAVICGGALYISVIVLMGYGLPPVNNSILGTFSEGFADGPKILWERIAEQFRLMFKFRELNPNMAIVLQMLVVLGWGISRLWESIRVHAGVEAVLQSEDFFQMYNMASLLAAGLIFYLQEGMYRTFAPAMLMVFLLQVVQRDYKRLLALLTVNLLFFASYMTFYARVGDYRIVEADYTGGSPWDEQTAAEFEKFMVYDPKAGNPWCNTLLIPLEYYDSRLMLVPPGIGVSYILDDQNYLPPIKSKYVLFDQRTYERYQGQTSLELLASLPAGDLYLNREVVCSGVR